MDPLLFTPRTALLVAVLFGPSCVTYSPSPLRPDEVWADTSALELTAPDRPAAAATGGFTPLELAAFAIEHHPALARARAEVGVGQALAREAGLWPGLELGWDGMDALASEWVAGHTTSVDYLSGLNLSIGLPRPGELDAARDAASWETLELRAKLLEAEWQLMRDVQAACVELATRELLRKETASVVELARHSRDYFAGAAEVGAATATEASLAAGDWYALQADVLALEARHGEAQRQLNALLGLRPDYLVVLAASESWNFKGLERTLEALQAEALEQRPDLLVARSRHEVNEARVRLQIARQFPQISIGTSLGIRTGFLRSFQRPEIATALAQREVSRSEYAARLFTVRAELFDAFVSHQDAQRQSAWVASELMPNVEASRSAITAAFDSGEATLLETLNVQRSYLAARLRLSSAHAEELLAAIHLLTVSGQLAGDTLSAPGGQL